MYEKCPETFVVIVKEEDVDKIEQLQIPFIAYTQQNVPCPSFQNCEISEQVKKELHSHEFNMWEYNEDDYLSMIKYMFEDLDLINSFHIDTRTLDNFLAKIRQNYNSNPYHNFHHCFAVTQMMFSVVQTADLLNIPEFSIEDIFVLILACICHDLDHPGLSNSFMIKSETELASRYESISCLEKHHSTVAMDILSEDTNILRNLPESQIRRIRKAMVKMILATDMSFHSEFVNCLKNLLNSDVTDSNGNSVSAFSLKNHAHKTLAMQLLVKACDISNEVRPVSVGERWVDNLLEEFFHQGDLEKSKGWQPILLLDREKLDRYESQKGFIGYVSLPLFQLLAKCFPKFESTFVKSLNSSYEYYSGKLHSLS
eukprot:Sdes_comp19732_c0_seq1m11705